MKRIPVIPFAFLLTLAAAPCSAQKAQAPLPPAEAPTKKQNAIEVFTQAEVVQFFHTVQTQAISWKETISSIQPPAPGIAGHAKSPLEEKNGTLPFYLDDIGKLRPAGGGTYKGIDLETTAIVDSLTLVIVEFQLFSDLCEIKEDVIQLALALADDPRGAPDSGRLLEIYKEASTAKNTLWTEIMNRIMGAGVQTLDHRFQKPCKE
jgi:hypothetical protein